MRKMAFLMALVALVALLTGCQARTGTMLGTALGGAIGGIVPALLPEASPAVQTIAPIAGAVVGGGIGYMFDSSKQEEEETAKALKEQQEMQAQQAQQAQVQLQELRQSTKLSAPVAVWIGNQAYQARNNVELANILFQIQPGAQFGILTNNANVKAVSNDMASNGYISIGAPKKMHGKTLINFQKPGGQMTPMTLEQAAKAF